LKGGFSRMGTYMDRVKYRFSSKRFHKVIHSLSEDQKGFLEKYGLERFLGFQKFNVPMPFLEWVMGQVVVDLSEFKHRVKSFKFTRFMVQQILGIPSGDIPIHLHNAGSKPCDPRSQPNPIVMPGSKLSIRDAVTKLLGEHDEDSFIRLFMLVALSTIICPSTQNFVNLNYVPYLSDVSQINSYDWSSHAMGYIFAEVKKYQGFISSKDSGKIYVGSCLSLLAIAYLDFVDLSSNYANHHKISYELPRICNVSSEDFCFVANVDRNLSNPGRPSFGILEFRSLSSSPYFEASDNVESFQPAISLYSDEASVPHPPSLYCEATDNAESFQPAISLNSNQATVPHPSSPYRQATDDVDLFHPAICMNSGQAPVPHPETYSPFQIPPSTQDLIAKHCNCLKNDISSKIISNGEQAYSDFSDVFRLVFLNRLALLSAEIVSDTVSASCVPDFHKDGNSEFVPVSTVYDPSPQTSARQTLQLSSTAQFDKSATPNTGPVFDPSPLPSATNNILVNDTFFIQKDVSTDSIDYSSDRVEQIFHSCYTPQVEQDDINSPSTPVFTHQTGYSEPIIDVSQTNLRVNAKRKCGMGSSTIEKKKRKKRAAIPLDDGSSFVKVKLNQEIELSYIKYVRLQHIEQNDNEPSPIFISISGFQCSYHSFQQSLMPRGFVLNDLMAVYVQYFNNDHKNNSESSYDRNKVAFTPFLVEKLMMDYTTYIPESNEPELTRINEQMDIANADLLLFPFLLNDHWVLICINYLLKQVEFFDPSIHVQSSESVLPINSINYIANNVVFNFQRTCKIAEIFDRDLKSYQLQVPRCPKHSNSDFQKYFIFNLFHNVFSKQSFLFCYVA